MSMEFSVDDLPRLSMCRGHAQRRRYMLPEGGSGIMLVHYLAQASAPGTPEQDSTEPEEETVRAQARERECGHARVTSALPVSCRRFWQAADSASGVLLTVRLRGLLGHALAGACA